MTGVITILSAGTGTGPFYIYSDVDGFTVPFISAVSKEALLSGLPVDNIPDGTTIVRVKSLNSVCNNYTDIDVYPATTTTTTTSEEFNSYMYEMSALGCVGCSPSFGTDILNNSEPLTIGNWYQVNFGVVIAIQVLTFLGESVDLPDVFINNIDGVASCELLPCNSETTTTTTTTEEPTTTTTTTTNECGGIHPTYSILYLRIDIGVGVYIDFSVSLEDACAASACVSDFSCYLSAGHVTYSNNLALTPGDILYTEEDSCSIVNITGYFLLGTDPTTIVHVIAGEVIELLTCTTTTTTTIP